MLGFCRINSLCGYMLFESGTSFFGRSLSLTEGEKKREGGKEEGKKGGGKEGEEGGRKGRKREGGRKETWVNFGSKLQSVVAGEALQQEHEAAGHPLSTGRTG